MNKKDFEFIEKAFDSRKLTIKKITKKEIESFRRINKNND